MQKLLLLHGALDTKAQFNKLSNLLRNDFEVLTVNFPGHGGEPMPEEEFSIKFFSDEAVNFLNKNKIDSVNISGHSMGGYTGLYIARFYPERVKKVFTLNTKLYWNEEIAAGEVKLLNADKIIQKIPRYAQKLEQLHKPNNWRTLLEKTAAMLTGMGIGKKLTDEDFGKIEHEVLLAVGDRDKMVSIGETTDIFKKIKNASLLVLPDTPHPFESISAERLAYEMKSFFSR